MVRPIVAELRRRFEVSAAETGDSDLHRRAEVGGRAGRRRRTRTCVEVLDGVRAADRRPARGRAAVGPRAGCSTTTIWTSDGRGARRWPTRRGRDGIAGRIKQIVATTIETQIKDPRLGHGDDHRRPGHRRPARRDRLLHRARRRGGAGRLRGRARVGPRRAAQRGRPADRGAVHADADLHPRRAAGQRPPARGPARRRGRRGRQGARPPAQGATPAGDADPYRKPRVTDDDVPAAEDRRRPSPTAPAGPRPQARPSRDRSAGSARHGTLSGDTSRAPRGPPARPRPRPRAAPAAAGRRAAHAGSARRRGRAARPRTQASRRATSLARSRTIRPRRAAAA